MSFAYAQHFGADWLSRIASPAQRQLWSDWADEESQRRGKRGVYAVPTAGLGYSNLYDLIDIAAKNWAPLAAALGDRKRALPLLDRADQLRNAVAHSRPLLPFEQDLLAGISGQIRNQVILYMSTQDAAGDIYPRIESINRRIWSAHRIHYREQ